MQPTKTEKADSDAFYASLALFDRDEPAQRARALPADTDVDAVIEAAFERALGNPSRLPF